jgi:hypothetical protein
MASFVTAGALGHTLGEQSHVAVGTEAHHVVCRQQRWAAAPSYTFRGCVQKKEPCRVVPDGICVSLCSLLCTGVSLCPCVSLCSLLCTGEPVLKALSVPLCSYSWLYCSFLARSCL